MMNIERERKLWGEKTQNEHSLSSFSAITCQWNGEFRDRDRRNREIKGAESTHDCKGTMNTERDREKEREREREKRENYGERKLRKSILCQKFLREKTANGMESLETEIKEIRR